MTEWDIVKLQEMAWSDFALKHGLVSQLPRNSEHQWIGFHGTNDHIFHGKIDGFPSFLVEIFP